MRAQIAAEAVDAAFEELGTPAQYVAPGGGPAVTFLAIRARPDVAITPGMAPLVEGSDAVDLRASEIPAPARGGTIALDGATLTIAAKPMTTDAERLVWRCPVR